MGGTLEGEAPDNLKDVRTKDEESAADRFLNSTNLTGSFRYGGDGTNALLGIRAARPA
jgi:hypothetical protein